MHNAAVEKALSLVGQGYIYGAKGQTCSLAFRQQQAAQYPDQAENILGTGAKWDGKPVWDCAQLTRVCAKAGGVNLVSGATSQWDKTGWQERGPIETIPEGETVFVYRRKSGSDSVMQHTGVALGDGTCVHARGTAYGVVRQNMNEYAWTHWAAPAWQETEERPLGTTATVTAPSGTVNMRTNPTRSASLVERLAIGTVVQVLGEAQDNDGEKWLRVQSGTVAGYMMARYLKQDEPNESQKPVNVTITLPRDVAAAMLNALEKVVKA